MKYTILIAVIIVLVVASLFVYLRQVQAPAVPKITFGENIEYSFERVSDPLKQAKGLGGRESLESGHGMLFVFNRPRQQNFWMKGMLIPLDVIWISDFKVIGITENILPPAETNGEIQRMSSPGPADMVLEINAGEAKNRGIEVGMSVNIDKN